MMPQAERAPFRRVCDYVALRLAALDVSYAFGVNGANIEDLFEAAHRAGGPRTIVAKHESSAVAMAHGDHLRSGGLGVVFTTSGGGAFNTVAPLAEALASRVPLLAVIGQVPRALEGRGGFQDSSGAPGTPDARRVFSAVSVSCLAATRAEEVPDALERSVTTALRERGPSVLLLPKDVQQSPLDASPDAYGGISARPAEPTPAWDGWPRVAAALAGSRRPPLVILGEDVIADAAVDPALDLVQRLDARVAVTPGAKGLYDHRSPRFVGVTGVMGHPSVQTYLERTDVCVVVGTPLPALARYGLERLLAEKTLVLIGSRPTFLDLPAGDESGTGPVRVRVPAPLLERLMELNAYLGDRRSPPGESGSGSGAIEYLSVPASGTRLTYEAVVSAIAPFVGDDGDVFVDAGNAGAAVVHHLPVSGKGLFFVALGMGGMGYGFGAAIGSAVRSRRRTFLFAGDGAFYMHGLELHTAVEHDLPLVTVIFDNHGHVMCEQRDDLFLEGARGENIFKPAHIGRGLAAMFPSMLSFEASDAQGVSRAMQEIDAHRGPALLSVAIDPSELPPFVPFLDRLAARRAREDRHAHR